MSHDKFSLSNFKKWMGEQEINSPQSKPRKFKPLVGLQVESKIHVEKLLSKMQTEEGDAEILAEEFVEDGGQIADVNDKSFLIEVASGTFYVHRCYVRKA